MAGEDGFGETVARRVVPLEEGSQSIQVATLPALGKVNIARITQSKGLQVQGNRDFAWPSRLV
jgi:hypothetical protein